MDAEDAPADHNADRIESRVKVAVVVVLGAVTLAAGFSKTAAWTLHAVPSNGQWYAWATACIPELLVVAAMLSIRQRRRWGVGHTYPAALMAAAGLFTVVTQLGVHTPADPYVARVVAAVSLICLSKLIFADIEAKKTYDQRRAAAERRSQEAGARKAEAEALRAVELEAARTAASEAEARLAAEADRAVRAEVEAAEARNLAEAEAEARRNAEAEASRWKAEARKAAERKTEPAHERNLHVVPAAEDRKPAAKGETANERWRRLYAELIAQHPDLTQAEAAKRLGTSDRTLRKALNDTQEMTA